MLLVSYNQPYSKYNSRLWSKRDNSEIYVALTVTFMTLAFIKGHVTLTIYYAYTWASFYDTVISIPNNMH